MANSSSITQYPSLNDALVLITGGASGIGAAMVHHFAGQGSRVVFLDVADDCASDLIDRVGMEASHNPVYHHCDLTNVEDLRFAIAKTVAEAGPIRVLVNNAANDDRHRFEDITPEYWDQRLAVNLRHQFFATQAVASGMKSAGGGSIVNMSSIAWMIPSTGLPVYATAKAAIVGMTRTLARELGEANIRVNAISPGAIMTERQRRLWMTQGYLAEILQRQSLKKELMPDDVAKLVLFLASDDSSCITGQNFVIDGGWV
jgi:D-xylose 1-dehydrogenase